MVRTGILKRFKKPSKKPTAREIAASGLGLIDLTSGLEKS